MTTQIIEIGSSYWVRFLDGTGTAWLLHRFDRWQEADDYATAFQARYDQARAAGQWGSKAIDLATRYADRWIERQRLEGVA